MYYNLIFCSFTCLILVLFLDIIPHLYVEGQNSSNETESNETDEFRIINKVCLLKPMVGPCRSQIRMFYFEPETLSCVGFRWGGCQGNGNRFDSKRECRESCLDVFEPNETIRPRYCDLAFDYGFCFGSIKRWYYDRIWKTCKETIYSGCGGNRNNFYVKDHCLQTCQFARRKIKRI